MATCRAGPQPRFDRPGGNRLRNLIDTLGVIRPQTQALLDKLTDVPVDIAPRFTTAQALLQER